MRMQPIQSFKQITVDGPASRAAATNILHRFVVGVDNYTGPSAANDEVPTGAKVMSATLFLSFSNLVAVSALLHYHIQCQRTGSPIITPGAQGGSPSRNTVIHTGMLFIGKEQNTNFQIQLRIPRIFQRIREGDQFFIVYRVDAVFASATQALYKFYR